MTKIQTLLNKVERVFKPLSSHRCIAFGVVALALLIQFATASFGIISVAADDSARTLLADELSLGSALDPFFWPPLPKIIYGIGLWIHTDLFLTPRIITNISSLALIASVSFLAHRLYGANTTTLITAAICSVLSHRVIFSSAPMAEPIFNPLMIMSFAFFVGVIRDNSKRDLYVTCLLLSLACATRYEAWFITMAFGGYIAFGCFFLKKFSSFELISCALIVSAFPVYWIAAASFSEGGLATIMVTHVQAQAIGTSLVTAVRHNHLFVFLDDLLQTPLMIALIPIAISLFTKGWRRIWIVAAATSLLLVSLLTFASSSVAYAMPWRLSGIWTLLLIPFLADWIRNLSERSPTQYRGMVIMCTIILVMGAFSFQTLNRALSLRESAPFPSTDLQAGDFIEDWLATNARGNVLVEANGQYRFLNILVSANNSDRVFLSTGDDVQMIALHIGQADYWEAADPVRYESYISPKYGLAQGGALSKLKQENIKMVLVETSSYVDALESSSNFDAAAKFGDWIVFHLIE